MSRNKPPRPTKLAIDVIRTILLKSQWLDNNKETVARQLLNFTKEALGIGGCNKFEIKEGKLNYGVFSTIHIRCIGFDYDIQDANEEDISHTTIKCCYWGVEIPGLGTALDKHHPEDLVEDCNGDIMFHDDYIGCFELHYEPTTDSLVPKLEYETFKLKFTPVYEK